MGFQDLLDNRQPQTRTDHGAAVDLVDLVVAIPDEGDLVGGDAHTAVRDRHADSRAVIAELLGHPNQLVLARIVDGVVDEIIDNLYDKTALNLMFWTGIRIAELMGLTKADIDRLVNTSIRHSDRYRIGKKAGKSHEEILEEFNTPVEMTVFSYKGTQDGRYDRL